MRREKERSEKKREEIEERGTKRYESERVRRERGVDRQ